MNQDTIAAISTGLGTGGIGIVRISGPDAIACADKVFRGAQRIKDAESHTILYGHIVAYEDTLSSPTHARQEQWQDPEPEVIDEVLVTVMRAPRTYTREDVVEINGHGGLFVMKRILENVLRTGVRLAEPGEFTKRAFLNGRIDLTQAEAVMDLISAENQSAEKSALQQLSGAIRNIIRTSREHILYETAYIEAALDDPEHYDLTGYGEELLEKIDAEREVLKKLYDTAEDGKIVREGIATVILGRPNVGKSTLMNALSGTETAIVTDIAGTTRDVLEENISLRGLPLRVMDTAGIRETDNVIEKIGVERALSCADRADLILYVIDAAQDFTAEEKEQLAQLSGRNMIILLNKSDLPGKIEKETIRSIVDAPVIYISAKEMSGMDELADYIRDLFFSGEASFNSEVYITNARQKEALGSAIVSLDMVRQTIEDGMPEDLYTVDLMDAYKALGKITGEDVGEDLVNEIFSKFCMGK